MNWGFALLILGRFALGLLIATSRSLPQRRPVKPLNLYLNWALILSIGMGVVSRLGCTVHFVVAIQAVLSSAAIPGAFPFL